MPSFCVSSAINKWAGVICGLPAAVAACNAAVSAAWVFVVGLNESTTPLFQFLCGADFGQAAWIKMLLGFYNAVKVESVPLNFNQFRTICGVAVATRAPASYSEDTVVMRFNPPPNWPPVPLGWTPPPGWQPDPSWPPPPPGWPLWVNDVAPKPAGRRNLLIFGGLAIALLLVVGAVITVVLLRSPSGTTTATPTSVSQQTDEDQIKDAVSKFEDAWNDRNFDGFKPILCEQMQNDEEFNEEDFLDARNDSGRVQLDVKSIEVDGDSATATVTHDGDDDDSVEFVREGGAWKWCKL
jgi:hypothetical protein